MSDNWTMPDWMREIYGEIAPKLGADYIAQQYIQQQAMKGFCRYAYEVNLLLTLHTHGLLLTPGEDKEIAGWSAELTRLRFDNTRLRAENERMREALAKIGEWLLIHDLTIVDKMKQVTAALGAEHEC